METSTELVPLSEPVYFDLKQSQWEENRTERCKCMAQVIAAMAAALPNLEVSNGSYDSERYKFGNQLQSVLASFLSLTQEQYFAPPQYKSQ